MMDGAHTMLKQEIGMNTNTTSDLVSRMTTVDAEVAVNMPTSEAEREAVMQAEDRRGRVKARFHGATKRNGREPLVATIRSRANMVVEVPVAPPESNERVRTTVDPGRRP
jgi:hypothetical protein